MSFCMRCGNQLLPGVAFCGKCGQPAAAGAAGAPMSASPSAEGFSGPRPASPQAHDLPMAAGGAAGAPSDHNEVIEGLKRIYREKVKPLEQMYKFDEFTSPCLSDTDFDAKPMIMLLGQYSTGKTTFIRYLLERDFPGVRIGPEPTTDRFMAIMWGAQEVILPGNAVAVQPDKPFTALQKFGMAFLNKFEVSQCPSPILEKVSFIDTPGVLSGEKQRIGRSYNFSELCEWFAERADRILLLFDAHKLDISDEFKRSIESLKGHEDKIRVVLNKADQVDQQQLMRVYGALMWSLGKVFNTPETPRVYISSFWDQPFRYKDMAALLEVERDDLVSDLRALPRYNAIRKVNELVKRARCARVHALIIAHLRDQFGMFGKESTKKKLLDGLLDQFKAVQKKYSLPIGDFPNLPRFRESLERYEIHKFLKLNQKVIDSMNEMLATDMPILTRMLGAQFDQKNFVQQQQAAVINPFDLKDKPQESWMIDSATKAKFDNVFHTLTLTVDKVSGVNVKKTLADSGLATDVLRKVWELSDVDKDGFLDADEFAVCMYIIDALRNGHIEAPPDTLPEALVPPSKRK